MHDLEAAVMELMWSYDHAVGVRELADDLRRNRAVAPALVAKLVNRLRRSGWLRRELVDGTYLYEPTATRREYADRLMREALASGRNAASAFVIRIPSARAVPGPIRCVPG
ncbi:BlaI/MecI/CopY family transcriptional regulator [Actinomadura vinacea]|uniref:BlaI/MecI/CopY family transcriptional regulator n=1 Tax=Actinomadura vinacea TaxID=115336 RepID=UPI0031E2F57B